MSASGTPSVTKVTEFLGKITASGFMTSIQAGGMRYAGWELSFAERVLYLSIIYAFTEVHALVEIYTYYLIQ